MKFYFVTTILFLATATAHAANLYQPEGAYLVQRPDINKNGLTLVCNMAAEQLQLRGITDAGNVLSRLSKIENPQALDAEIKNLGLSQTHEARIRQCLKARQDFEIYLQKRRNAAQLAQ